MQTEKDKIIERFDSDCSTIGVENATSNALAEIFDHFERELEKVEDKLKHAIWKLEEKIELLENKNV